MNEISNELGKIGETLQHLEIRSMGSDAYWHADEADEAGNDPRHHKIGSKGHSAYMAMLRKNREAEQEQDAARYQEQGAEQKAFYAERAAAWAAEHGAESDKSIMEAYGYES